MPGHHAAVDVVQATFPDTLSQVVGTVLALLLLSLSGVVVKRAGPVVKEHLDAALVESVQAGLMTVLTAGVGGFLVVVWRAGDQLSSALATIYPQQNDIIGIVFTVAILAGAYSLTRVTKNSIRRFSRERSALSNHQQEVAHHVVQLTIYVLAMLVVLGIWGVKPESLLVGAGVATVVLGLAARQTLGAVLAGFVVLFSRPFELGDWVQIGDQEGVVTDITIVNTQIRTFDEEYVMIPNDVVTSTKIVNRSRKGRLRLETDVGVDYDTHVEDAMRVATEAMAEVDLLMDRPEPHVVLDGFGDSAVVLKLRYYIDNPSARKMWKARTQVVARVKDAFAQHDVRIPFPQRELSGRPEAGGLAVSDAPDVGAESEDGGDGVAEDERVDSATSAKNGEGGDE